MPFAIRMPDFGTNVTEVKISKWLVEVGAPVRRGTILAEIETDKVTTELECVAEGVLLERCAQAGEMVEAGRTIAYVGAPGTQTVKEAASAAAVAVARPQPGSAEFLLDLYRQMLLIRNFEERVKYLFLEGVMPGTIHQYQGQEAIAVGVCAALEIDDVITSTHRPHGHAIAKGIVPAVVIQLGRVTPGGSKYALDPTATPTAWGGFVSRAGSRP